MPVSMPIGAPPLPPGPHPSLLAGNQQQAYQQNMQQAQHQQSLPQQMTSHPLQPSNLPQLQPPHMPLMPHPHLPRPPHQLQQVNMPGLLSSMPGSGSIQAMPIPGPMGIQGNMNQMVPPMPQGHFVGMPSGSGPQGNVPPGGMPNGLPNMQGPQNPGGNQMFPPGRGFNRQQARMPCKCGKACSMQSCWDGGEVRRRYWHCMNQFYKVSGEPICDFEEWVDEPCYQECYREQLQYLHNVCLRQREQERESNRTIADLRAKLKEVGEAQWNCEAQKERKKEI
ncbi:PREDICTED: uncharacterized protein LOC109218996 [Nicotiana attenuata]|uniref:uncharacterized protein LOC109218996 n=1 Tax=Nicotiana attenuata TaxID=49451 RepID=UPI000905461D|nr:PREDICTED: uncharacterized protein LOC109218996 [Nicotiana attenuata]